MEQKQSFGSELIDRFECARRLGVSDHTLYLWIRAGIIPHVRLGPKLIRFRPQDVERFIDSREVESS
jgi:excisionase family DNA binding protein